MRQVASAESHETSEAETDRFLSNLRRCMESSGYREGALSQAIGRNRGWLNGIFARKSMPNALDCHRLAKVLGVPMDALFDERSDVSPRSADQMIRDYVNNIQDQRGYRRPQVHELISWHAENRGRLVNHEKFQDFYELFAPPNLEENMLVPHWVGKHSLCSIELGITTPEDLISVLLVADQQVRNEVVRSHQRIFDAWKPDTTIRTLEFRFAEGLKVKVDYIRLLLPVRDANDARFVMNFTMPIRRVEISTDEILRYDAAKDERPVLYSMR